MADLPSRAGRAPVSATLDTAACRSHPRSRQVQKARYRNQRGSARPRRKLHHRSQTSWPEIHLRNRFPQPKRRTLLLLLPDGPEMRTEGSRYVRAEEEVGIKKN